MRRRLELFYTYLLARRNARDLFERPAFVILSCRTVRYHLAMKIECVFVPAQHRFDVLVVLLVLHRVPGAVVVRDKGDRNRAMRTYEQIEPLSELIAFDSIFVDSAYAIRTGNGDNVYPIDTELLANGIIDVYALLMQAPVRAENSDSQPFSFR
jgi:hypothetical protein